MGVARPVLGQHVRRGRAYPYPRRPGERTTPGAEHPNSVRLPTLTCAFDAVTQDVSSVGEGAGRAVSSVISAGLSGLALTLLGRAGVGA